MKEQSKENTVNNQDLNEKNQKDFVEQEGAASEYSDTGSLSEEQNSTIDPGNESENQAQSIENPTTQNLQLKVDEYADLLKRKMAEFDNYKRRTELEKQEIAEYGASRFISQILPVVDDFDRTISHLGTASDLETLKKGVIAVYEKLQKVLLNNKVVKVPSVGTPFDVNLHEAMLYQPSNQFPPDTVINEFIPAYRYKERVIRHAQVVVSDDSSAPAENPPTETQS